MVEQSYKELPYRLEGEEAGALEAPAIRRGYVGMSMKITIFAPFDDCLERREALLPPRTERTRVMGN